MRQVIGHLGEDPQSDGGVADGGVEVGIKSSGPPRCGNIGGGIQVVGKVQASEDPVVCRVLGDVRGGHGGSAEPVDENGFVLALEEMQSAECAEDQLRGRRGRHELSGRGRIEGDVTEGVVRR